MKTLGQIAFEAHTMATKGNWGDWQQADKRAWELAAEKVAIEAESRLCEKMRSILELPSDWKEGD